MGQAFDPETLVIHQEVTPGNNPEDFKQRYDHGRSLQLQPTQLLFLSGSTYSPPLSLLKCLQFIGYLKLPISLSIKVSHYCMHIYVLEGNFGRHYTATLMLALWS
jgi:hypothetical protein